MATPAAKTDATEIARTRGGRRLVRWKTTATSPPKKTVDMAAWPLGKLYVVSFTSDGQSCGRAREKAILKAELSVNPPATVPMKRSAETRWWASRKPKETAAVAKTTNQASPKNGASSIARVRGADRRP